MSEQPTVTDLLREASERLTESQDKLDAAQLLERERREKLVEKMNAAGRAFVELVDAVEERVK